MADASTAGPHLHVIHPVPHLVCVSSHLVLHSSLAREGTTPTAGAAAGEGVSPAYRRGPTYLRRQRISCARFFLSILCLFFVFFWRSMFLNLFCFLKAGSVFDFDYISPLCTCIRFGLCVLYYIAMIS